MRAEYSYNDRGRGDHIVATWKLDADGLPIEYEGRGNDYMKAPVEEHFEMKNGRASWKNRSEQGDQEVTGKAFYLPMDAPPEFLGVLVRALLKAPNHKLALLPAGEASIEEAGKQASLPARATDRVPHHGSWLYSAIDLARTSDGNRGVDIGWFSVVSTQYEAAMAQLRTAQEKTDDEWSSGSRTNLPTFRKPILSSVTPASSIRAT